MVMEGPNMSSIGTTFDFKLGLISLKNCLTFSRRSSIGSMSSCKTFSKKKTFFKLKNQVELLWTKFGKKIQTKKMLLLTFVHVGLCHTKSDLIICKSTHLRQEYFMSRMKPKTGITDDKYSD